MPRELTTLEEQEEILKKKFTYKNGNISFVLLKFHQQKMAEIKKNIHQQINQKNY